MSDAGLQLTAATSEAARNSVIAPMNVARSPYDSASHAVPSIVAVVAARKPAAIHCSVSWPTWNSSISAGNATLTIVEARIVDTVPSIIVATTSARVVLAVSESSPDGAMRQVRRWAVVRRTETWKRGA